MALENLVIWLVGYFVIWFALLRRRELIWKLVGASMVFLNSVLSVLILDSIITMFVMLISVIYLFVVVVEAIQKVRF